METNLRPFPKLPGASKSGVALVMTLITLSIIAILLIGFVSSMSLERQAAHAFADGQQAKLIAQGAVAHAVDLLRTNIPDPALLSQGPQRLPTGGTDNMSAVNWVINPGRLTVIKGSAPPQYIPLHTGAVTNPPGAGAPPDADSYDLNQPLPGQTTPVITGTPSDGSTTVPPMRVAWVNLFNDPSSAPGVTNPLVGRYAFWIDDECARLNFNTALGKPQPVAGSIFGDELANGFMTPLFAAGDSATLTSASYSTTTGARLWALGRPQSVNLDVLLGAPSQLKTNQLFDQVFLHGFNRYPEAVMNYVSPPSTPQSWFDQQKFNLTFYNRSPEFNSFGLSRLFTTYIPMSLEGGPSYQHPFIYNNILFLNSLFGTFGFTTPITNDVSGTVDGGNIANQYQLDLILSYLERPWPGYSRSFFDKYGPQECTQIALNLLLMARMATCPISNTPNDPNGLVNFSSDWAVRSTSVNYAPASTTLAGCTPERMYWSFLFPTADNPNPSPTLMLPQMPGPHITEVRLFVQAVPVTIPPGNVAINPKVYKNPYYIQYWYEAKYYMHPGGPVVDLSQFPVRMDYLDINATYGNTATAQAFGQTSASDTANVAANWNYADSLAQLQIAPPTGTVLGPTAATYPKTTVSNWVSVKSTPVFIGSVSTEVPNVVSTAKNPYKTWTPQIFTQAQGPVNVTIRLRPGMSVAAAPARPRQMIPLGETPKDTLQATFTVAPLDAAGGQTGGSQQAVSWQIADPRLSWDVKQWQANKQGPGDPSTIGNPNKANASEPAETSTEKSKFRYLERAASGTGIAVTPTTSYALDRPDEYDTASRVSSPGYWSFIHTGIQSSQPWRTLNLGSAANQTSPPDWLLLDLIGATYPMVGDQFAVNKALPDSFSTLSYMNSTAGQVNLNSRIYPQTPYFQPPARVLPLEGVFEYLRNDLNPGTGLQAFVNNINAYQTDSQFFSYVGELANVSGFSNGAGTQWDSEMLLRNMAGCLTTKSNTFGVWGVAQVVKKLTKNQQYGQFETGDQVVAEKRFYALVERYIWPGRDGVPGNAHFNSSGHWDSLATQAAPVTPAAVNYSLYGLPGSPHLKSTGGTELALDMITTNGTQTYTGTYPVLDGPQTVSMVSTQSTPTALQDALGKITYKRSSLEDADNPPQAAIKYRIVYFKYLDQ